MCCLPAGLWQILLAERKQEGETVLPGGSWMFWMFVVFCWGWLSRGASTCGAGGRTPPGAAAIVDGAAVLGFGQTPGLLMVAVAPGGGAAWPPVRMTLFVQSDLVTGELLETLMPGDEEVRTGLLVEVCMSGFTSVTVGTVVLAPGWAGTTPGEGAFWALKVVRMIVLGWTAAASSLHAGAGPLGCELSALLSAMWQFVTAALPFKLWAPAGFSSPDAASDAAVTTPLAVAGWGWLWAGLPTASAAGVTPAAPSILGTRHPALLLTPLWTPDPTAAETHENKWSAQQLSESL